MTKHNTAPVTEAERSTKGSADDLSLDGTNSKWKPSLISRLWPSSQQTLVKFEDGSNSTLLDFVSE